MSVNKTVFNRPLVALLVLMLSCAGVYTWAQESDTPDPNSKTTDAPAPAANADATELQTTNESSPSDYQASEEISQDLSVSFPADI